MKRAIIVSLLFTVLSNTSLCQKTLNFSNLNTIPMGNEMGLVRDYTKDEILTFIETSGWVSCNKENISVIPKVIFRLSPQAITQLHVEVKNTWYRGLTNNATEELRSRITSKYGTISEANFKRFGVLLLLLEKVDRDIKYL